MTTNGETAWREAQWEHEAAQIDRALEVAEQQLGEAEQRLLAAKQHLRRASARGPALMYWAQQVQGLHTERSRLRAERNQLRTERNRLGARLDDLDAWKGRSSP